MDPITLHPRVGASALELVKRFEGFRARATPLAGGGFVIGYGHLLATDPERLVTPSEGEALLRYDLSRLAAAIEPTILAPVSDRQFDTLLSFAFGVGVDAFAASIVLRRLNAGAPLDAAAALELWRVAEVDGEPLVVDLLVRRRAAEKAHFLEPPEGFLPASSAQLRPLLDEAGLAAVEATAGHDVRVARVAVTGEGTISPSSPDHDGEPAPSLALAAVAALSVRLDELFAAEPPPPPVIQAAGPESEPEPEPVVGAAEPEPAPAVEAAPAPAVLPVAAEAANDHGRAPTESKPRRPRRGALSWARVPAVLIGVVGLLVFALAVFRIYRAPSLADLGLGVLGVVAMTPAAMWLSTPRRRKHG